MLNAPQPPVPGSITTREDGLTIYQTPGGGRFYFRNRPPKNPKYNDLYVLLPSHGGCSAHFTIEQAEDLHRRLGEQLARAKAAAAKQA